VDVTNTGARAGDEVVQLYARYPESKVDRPRKQLRGFERVTLGPHETRTVRFRLAAEDVAYWEASRRAWLVERAPVELMAGGSSADAALAQRVRLVVSP
jgi:beta-glucosidase